MPFHRISVDMNHGSHNLPPTMDLLTESCNVAKPERGPGPSHNIPYEKDCRFVNRDDILTAIEKAHAPVGHRRAGLFGIGGIG